MKTRTIARLKGCYPTFFARRDVSEKSYQAVPHQEEASGILFMAPTTFRYSPISGKRLRSNGVTRFETAKVGTSHKEVAADCYRLPLKTSGLAIFANADVVTALAATGETHIYSPFTGEKCALNLSKLTAMSDDIEEEMDSEEPSLEDDEGDMDLDDDSGDDDMDMDSEDDDMDMDMDNEDTDLDDEDDPLLDDGDDEESSLIDDKEIAKLYTELSASLEELDNEDKDTELASLIQELAESLEEMDDSDDEGEDDKPSLEDNDDEEEEETEVVKKKAVKEEIPTDSGMPTEVKVTASLHNVVKGPLQLAFLTDDVALAMINNISIGTFNKEAASINGRNAYSSKEVLRKLVTTAINNGALEEEKPSEELTDLGFKPATVELDLTENVKEMIDNQVSEKTSEIQQTTTAQVEDVSKEYAKLVGIASMGLNKGLIRPENKKASVITALANQLSAYGEKRPASKAVAFMKNVFEPYMGEVIAQANKLAKKDGGYLQGYAESVANAAYASDSDITEDEDKEAVSVTEVSTASLHIPQIVPQTAIRRSEKETASAQNYSTPSLHDKLASLGRR
jgi:hypothetical protein